MDRKYAMVIHKDKIEETFKDFSMMDPKNFGLMDRVLCETDTNYRQVIPYIALVDISAETPKVFVYTRGEKGDEVRLHGMCSIGLGGHVDTENDPDYDEIDYVMYDHFINETYREILEEVGLELTDPNIYDLDIPEKIIMIDDTDVDKVHLGIPMILTLNGRELIEMEEGVITKGEWKTISEINESVESGEIQLEAWSNIMLNIIEETLNQ